jgi:hypothetical protein
MFICPLRFPHINDVQGRLYLLLLVGRLVSYLRYLCLFTHSGVQHILRGVFRRIVYPMLPVSLKCLIAPSVFVDVYSQQIIREVHANMSHHVLYFFCYIWFDSG